MQSVSQQVRSTSLPRSRPVSLWAEFSSWCDKQEEYRFGWTAGIIIGHGCIFTIITVLAILFTGNHFIYWPFAIAAMAFPLVSNLAAMPMRVIIPVFFGSLVVDLAIIAFCLASGLSIETVYPRVQ